jgi:hypothetical protein
MLKTILLSAFVCMSSLQAIQIPAYHYAQPHPTVQSPWFTGPLLAPSAITIPPGHFNLEPYIYINANTGHYDHNWKRQKVETFWVNELQPSIQIGINNWMDFQLNPTLLYNYTKGAGKWVIGDMPIGFDFQLFHTSHLITKWNTALKLQLRETIPMGKYQKLNPKKLLTDVGGQGSWQTAAGLVWGNVFYLGGTCFVTWRHSFQYLIPAPVHVKNLNAFGGGRGTNGTVYPPQNFQYDMAIEITLSQNWAFACDILLSWSGKTRFKGKTLFPMTTPPQAQFSLAPAIEYNWNANIGIIFGSWFSFAGRNSTQFTSGVFAFNYYH